jgi:hypothetical protein
MGKLDEVGHVGNYGGSIIETRSWKRCSGIFFGYTGNLTSLQKSPKITMA